MSEWCGTIRRTELADGSVPLAGCAVAAEAFGPRSERARARVLTWRGRARVVRCKDSYSEAHVEHCCFAFVPSLLPCDCSQQIGNIQRSTQRTFLAGGALPHERRARAFERVRAVRLGDVLAHTAVLAQLVSARVRVCSRKTTHVRCTEQAGGREKINISLLTFTHILPTY